VTEYDDEPIRGLPGHLPAGEEILWQGGPDWRVFARHGFHTRWIAAYFVALTAYGLASGSLIGAALTVAAGAGCLGLLYLLAWAIAATTVYTLTNRRIVLRIGVALNACFNLPLKLISGAEYRPLGPDHGDLALHIENGRIGYLLLWPHARPWRLRQPQPMLRALPDGKLVAERLVKARAAIGPIARGEAVSDISPDQRRPGAPAMGAVA